MIQTEFYAGEKCVWVKQWPKRLSVRESQKLKEWIEMEFKVNIDRIDIRTIHVR